MRLFEAAGLASNARFGVITVHSSNVAGRFPHRNAILGRPSSEAENRYLASNEAFLG